MGGAELQFLQFIAYLQHERISNLSLRDVVSVRVADLHGAGRRRSGVGDGAGRGQGADVESNVEVVLSRLVDAPDPVGLRLVRHKLLVLLYDENKPRLALREAKKEANICIRSLT